MTVNFFFQRLNSESVKSYSGTSPNFYSGLLKNVLASFRSVINFFFTLELFSSKNESLVISSVLILFYASKNYLQKFQSSQNLLQNFTNFTKNFVRLKVKFPQKILKIFFTFFNLRFFEFRENFPENLLKILVNYLEIEEIELNFINY